MNPPTKNQLIQSSWIAENWTQSCKCVPFVFLWYHANVKWCWNWMGPNYRYLQTGCYHLWPVIIRCIFISHKVALFSLSCCPVWFMTGKHIWGWVTHICISKMTTIGSDNDLAPTKNQCCHIVNLTLQNTFQWNFIRNSIVFIQENPFKYFVWEMAANLSRSQCANKSKINAMLSWKKNKKHVY